MTFDDVRYAWRGMSASPGFTAVALLMIAIGTGTNAAMFSVIDAVMLRSPFTDPDRVVLVGARGADGRSTSAISLAQYRSLRESAQGFDALAAIASGQRPILTGLGEPKRFNTECVTAGMFRVLGTAPAIGRTFTEDEDRAGAPAVVVLSYPFWQRELGGSRDVVGRSVTLSGVPATVVGVMPRGFGGPLSRSNTDGWMPGGAALEGGASPGCAGRSSVNAFARLKPGLSLDAVAQQATDAAGIARLEDWRGHTGSRLALVSLQEQTIADLRTPLLALLAAVGLVLLIACANVANLQMERIFGRRVELAVRMALGATRARIIRQTLTETLILYVLGSIAGILAARWTLHLVIGLMPGSMPHLDDIELNVRILAATIAVACGSGIAVGLLPAIQETSPRLMNDLRAARAVTRGAGWTRRLLVVTQVALSLMLLVGAGLMIATFQTLRPSRPGFNAADKLTASIRLQGSAEHAPGPFFDRAIARVSELPGVGSVAASTYLPMSGNVAAVTVRAGDVTQEIYSGVVTPNYFAEMEIPILRGRGFSAADATGAPRVAIVNEAFVRRMFAGDDALGKFVDVDYYDKRQGARQIVGVLKDTRSSGSDLRARAEIYLPAAQAPSPSMFLIVRSQRPGDPRLAAGLRGAISAIDRAQVVDRIVPMQELLDARVSTWRFGAWLLGVFAAIAILLAAVGLGASIAWWVTQRTREIGVRMALGAKPRRIASLVLTQGIVLAASGVVLGLAGAAASTRFLSSWLYGVTALDRATFIVSALGMLLVAAVASYIPARRATRIDPLVALRAE